MEVAAVRQVSWLCREKGQRERREWISWLESRIADGGLNVSFKIENFTQEMRPLSELASSLIYLN